MHKLTIDELEMLNPFELGELLRNEVFNESPDFHFIDDILTVGCSIDTRDNDGQSILHAAAKVGNIYVMKFLLSRGAQVDARDNTSWTPLHVAAIHGNVNAIKFLISRGADLDARDDYGSTPWRWACRPDIREVLVELKAE